MPSKTEAHQIVASFIDSVDESLRFKQANVATCVVFSADDKNEATQAQFVTSADTETDVMIVQKIRQADPRALIVSEEGKADELVLSGDQHVWTVDPVDGTNNFVHGLPFGVLISQLNKKLVSEYGMVSLPGLKQRVFGSRSGGVFLNDQALVSQTDEIKGKAMVTIGPVAKPAEHGKIIEAIENTGVAVRDFGCTAWQTYQLLVGQSDCFIAYNLAIWDIGPALALAPALNLAVEWVSEPLNTQNITNKGYIHTVVFGKPTLVSQIAQALRSVR